MKWNQTIFLLVIIFNTLYTSYSKNSAKTVKEPVTTDSKEDDSTFELSDEELFGRSTIEDDNWNNSPNLICAEKSNF